MAKGSIYLIALAIVAPFLYDRYNWLSAVVANRPGKLQKIYNIKSHEVKFQDQIRNCEDLLIEEGMGIAFLGCDPGRDRWNTVMGTFLPPTSGRAGKDDAHIWIYDYSTPNLPDSEALKPLVFTDYASPADFHPLGMDFDTSTSTLYVINHSRHSGSIIDIFQISIKDATAKHISTFKHDLIPAPNSVHSLGNGKLLVTNDHYMRAAVSPLLSKIETFSGLPGGSIVYTDIHNPQDTKTLARIPFANGLAMLNSTTVAVASSSKPGVYLYSLNSSDHSLKFEKYIRTPASADNLSVDSNGKLLIAGHPFAPTLMKVTQGRSKCDFDGTEEEREACECTAPSWVAEWSEEEGLKEVYKDNGEEFCSSSTFARDVGRGIGMVSGLYERGVLVFRE
ncbi:calcium-dependent phosphotriesterase [Cucurbitaria berberidis CBS 394.84]|uniref:Calcium-dependent phosphotriesterase n=1 Tax=Cucurbitaria berberidis CBS 394.84 TaxID=1168544 RepID=A0A9P4L569_9PLEO|nr:calcium-dependent phosphotriesterase [Cucurbitaria berberidis CBS 394.84]KAF1841673.1 calcium-dependent phosphotriesterase [Cucurbitaria berberidis CBS 394.84]